MSTPVVEGQAPDGEACYDCPRAAGRGGRWFRRGSGRVILCAGCIARLRKAAKVSA